MCNADPWKTSFIAMKLGLATFIVPFMFFFGPELLMRGDWIYIAEVFVTASLGVFVLASSTEGWYAGGPIGIAVRAILFVSALLLMIPGIVTDLLGLAGAVLTYVYVHLSRRRSAAV